MKIKPGTPQTRDMVFETRLVSDEMRTIDYVASNVGEDRYRTRLKGMERKAGGYRSPSVATRVLSIISTENHQKWFQQIWSGLTGASTKNHPAPFPLELAERLIRMFSFVGDTVLDPFMGTGTTNLAASKWGRNSAWIRDRLALFQDGA